MPSSLDSLIRQICICSIVCGVLMANPVRAVAAPVDDASVAKMLDGVGPIAEIGSPGAVACWGPETRPLIASGDRGAMRALAAIGTWGDSRIVLFGHSGYSSLLWSDDAALRALGKNLLVWTVKGKGNPVVGVVNTDGKPAKVVEGCEIRTVTDQEIRDGLPGIDVLVTAMSPSPEQRVGLEKFLKRGGGLIASATGWGWRQLNREQPMTLHGMNILLAPVGMAFTDQMCDGGRDKTFEVVTIPPEMFAQPALRLIQEESSKGETPAKKPDAAMGKRLAQASTTLLDALRVAQPSDQLLRPSIDTLRAAQGSAIVPSQSKPLKDPVSRLIMTADLVDLANRFPSDQPAHPAAASFPGSIPADAARITKTITVSSRAAEWISTGLYAAPGEAIKVTRKSAQGKVAAGVGIRIGAHSDHLWHHPDWQRAPDITVAHPIKDGETTIASAFGGLVYITTTGKMQDVQNVTVTITGAVAAPLFVLGQTTNQEWQSTIRSAPAPWAELATDKVILTVPSASIRTLDDPTMLMEFWNKVLDADADLAAIPRDRPRPERICADIQISAGYMHSGYPIMTHLDAADDMTQLAKLSAGSWGLFHELGHNHQESDWTFDGTTEVTCNLFSLYVIEQVCGRPWSEGHGGMKDRAKQFADWEKKGRTFEVWKQEPFLALQMYAQLVEGFGWEPYKKVFAEYRTLTSDQRPKGDLAKHDQWMVRMSRAVGKNLGPFFVAWNVPTTETARASITDLPVWFPPDLPESWKSSAPASGQNPR